MIEILAYELTLFAACGYVLFGLEDFLFDLIWLNEVRSGRSVKAPLVANTNLVTGASPHIAVFVPAWQEFDVIEQMLSRCIRCWACGKYTIFVGCYPNDDATVSAARRMEGQLIEVVVLDHDGPTTKADCLNSIWSAMLAKEIVLGKKFSAVLLHDAEDFIHPEEIDLFSRLNGDWALAQIPVIPLADRSSNWVAGHYMDEFAEAHIKDLPVRQALGASLPSAGTGCAINRDKLWALAATQMGVPFDAKSLTEDYELGLRLSSLGGACHFIRQRGSRTQDIVAVHSFFPGSVKAAIRQKTRWTIGIALAGWDRIGWSGSWIEHWMRWRDRRTMLAACLITAGYCGFILNLGAVAIGKRGLQSGSLSILLLVTGFFFIWRASVRIYCTSAQYDWMQGACALPRIFVSNVITSLAAWRAIFGYAKILVTGRVTWDKTVHNFPPDHPQ